LQPNYGSYFRLPSINHNALPVAQAWTDYVQNHLDPFASPIIFTGNSAHAAEELGRRWPAYEEIGVKYVLAESNPFGWVPAVAFSGQVPAPLSAGQSLSGTIPAAELKFGQISTFGVDLGNSDNAATGRLQATLCLKNSCVSGVSLLPGARDHGILSLPLQRPLNIASNESLHYRISHLNGDKPVTIWLFPEMEENHEQIIAPSGGKVGYAPHIVLDLTPAGGMPRLIYHGAATDIYELPHPKPYFETQGGPCEVNAGGWQETTARCKAPATLIRRELFFPGWHAQVNGHPVEIARVAEIFQAVALPAGESRVVYAYWPPRIGFAYGAFFIGLAGLLFWGLKA
jgi:hypothetical protein